MGFMDELKKLTRPYAEDEEAFDDLEEQQRAPSSRALPDYDAEPARPVSRRGESRSKVVNIAATAQLQMVLSKPDRFDMVSEIADQLREKHAVVLNLEGTSKDVARRLVDFLSGCAYALDGKMKRIAASTYLITPYNVDIVGDLVEELENNGVYL